MDARDFNEQPPVVENGQYLEKIYELQKVLIDHYVKIEGLPSYPLDVNTKASQNLLKDFTGRVIEELAEGYESHLLAKEIWETNQYLVNSEAKDEHVQMIINHLQNLNEEEADAMHFMAELLIFANIQPEDIGSWVDKKTKELNLEHIIYKYSGDKQDIIGKAMELGLFIISEDNMTMEDYPGNTDIDEFMTEVQLAYVRGGRKINTGTWNIFLLSESFLWAVTYALSISRNCLKNKPWKQSGVMTNETLYQSKLVESFVYMMGYFRYLGMTSNDIYYLYFKKNLTNQFRIKSNY